MCLSIHIQTLGNCHLLVGIEYSSTIFKMLLLNIIFVKTILFMFVIKHLFIFK